MISSIAPFIQLLEYHYPANLTGIKALRKSPSIEIQGGVEGEHRFFRGRSGGDGRDFGLVDVDGAEREVRCQLSGIRCQVGGELGGALLAASR
jgi:hypothetical protein